MIFSDYNEMCEYLVDAFMLYYTNQTALDIKSHYSDVPCSVHLKITFRTIDGHGNGMECARDVEFCYMAPHGGDFDFGAMPELNEAAAVEIEDGQVEAFATEVIELLQKQLRDDD